MRRAIVLLAFVLAALQASAGDVTGRVSLAIDGMRLADLGPTVVYLATEGEAMTVARPPARAAIRQVNARFEPEFLVVTVGQSVEMPNEDAIFHNVFSFSRPNDFDLGVYPAGESHAVTFRHAGLVKIYCSIHESMSGAVLVTPTPWFALASPSGNYRITDVPPGSYEISFWNEKLPVASQPLRVEAAAPARFDVVLGRTRR
jgi:plastocyanin